MYPLVLHDVLGLFSGSLVGFLLGLAGGGGSILAIPLMVYVVGVSNPHVAMGTSAVAVTVNAAANLLPHARAGNVKWRCASIVAATGVTGAFTGATLSKLLDGPKLLTLFGLLMLLVAWLMLRRRSNPADAGAALEHGQIPKLGVTGLATGALAGFFGIGGGFLIVPGLIFATGMPAINAVGSSLVAVTAFAATAAAEHAASGLVEARLAALFIVGGIIGGLAGGRLAQVLGSKRGALNTLLAAIIAVVALYVLARSLMV